MFDISQIKQDPTINALGTLFQKDGNELNFSTILDFDTPNEVFDKYKRTISKFFDELQNAVEANTRMPNNVFAEIEFNKWLNDLDFDELRITSALLNTKYKPNALLTDVTVQYFKPEHDNDSTTCELRLRTVLIASNNCTQSYFFPIQTKSIVLVVYRAILEG